MNLKNNTNILVLGYYHDADGYLAFTDILRNYCNNVIFFPYIHYYNHHKNDLIQIIEKELITNNIKFIFFWHNIDTITLHMPFLIELGKLKNKLNIKLFNFNWDPDYKHTNFNYNPNIFDYIFTSNPFLIKNKTNYNIFYTGFNENTSYYKFDSKYLCDVSFIGTNLYNNNEWENNEFNREKILDTIIQNKEIKLSIYGTQNIALEKYKPFYKGFINYNKSYIVYSNSLFCLNISPLNNIEFNSFYYYSERLPQILACGSIMISNNNFGKLLIPNVDYIHVTDLSTLNDIIIEFKNNPEKREKMIKNYKKKINLFNYKHIISKYIYPKLIEFK
tara:strand:- start:3023 stop:4021 length:999 start_codon:yes stop_codon:yes gene_type:complete